MLIPMPANNAGTKYNAADISDAKKRSSNKEGESFAIVANRCNSTTLTPDIKIKLMPNNRMVTREMAFFSIIVL